MEVKRRYVVHSKDRVTAGKAIVGIAVTGLIASFIIILLPDILNGDIYRYDKNTWIITILSIGFFLFLMWFGLYGDKKQKWPDYILEIYENDWLRYQLKYRGSGVVWHDIFIPPDLIVGVGSYKKKYHEKTGRWNIQSDFGFTDGEKVYGAFLSGWIVEPEDTKEFDKLYEWFRKKGEENVKRLGIKVPKSFAWYGIGTWEESEKGRKLKEEGEKLLR